MPRRARKTIASPYIHVITQGIKKEFIFYKNMYKNEYIKLLKKTMEKYKDFYLLAYCIMDNHAHLLIYVENINDLSKMMGKVNTAYGIFYNKIEDRVGYVFRNRYYSQEIMNEEHLYNTIAYIHRNPLKANMVKHMEDYKYSSYNAIKNGKIDKESINLLFHTERYIKIFNLIHKNSNDENILEVEDVTISSEKINEIIVDFCNENKVTLKEVRRNNYLLNQIVNNIKEKYHVTNKRISEILGIGKNRISKIKKA